MKRSVKIFIIAMCALVTLGLVCIGSGVLLGGDFGAVISDIAADLYARLLGSVGQMPVN